MPHIHPPDAREVRLFQNKRNQTVKIPVGFAFDVNRVRIHCESGHLVIEPIHDNGLVTLLNRWRPLEEEILA